MSPEPQKISRQYDRIAEGYDEGIWKGKLGQRSLSKIAREEKEGILEIAAPEKDDIALDAACGTGRIFLELTKTCNTVYGMDISEDMLEVCKDKMKPKEVKGNLIRGNFFRLPLQRNSFSLITCLGATEYYNPEDIVKIIENMERILRPRGRIAITFQDEENSLIDKYIQASEEDLECKIHAYGIEKIERMVKEAGLQILEQERAGLQIQVLLQPESL